jgi:RNA polymerase sigma-70 factor (ECF subfamily)
MEQSDSELIKAVLGGDTSSFEKLIEKYQARIFGTVRRYSRTENEVEDIVQEIFIKAFRKLDSFRGEAPFEHWLMRMAVRTCYDFLRKHQRSREHSFTDLTKDESNWLEQFVSDPDAVDVTEDGARTLVHKLMGSLSPQAKLVITLQEIEGKSIKEISDMTGWSISLVKIRAFRARNEMRKQLEKIHLDKYL